MFCVKCGVENTSGAKFCKGCGNALDAFNGGHGAKKIIPAQGNVGGAANGTSESAAKANISQLAEKVKVLPKKIFIGICAAVVALIVIICVSINGGNTVNLNNYLTIEVTGYDGYGTARAKIDWNAIEEKYGNKFSFTSQSINKYGGFFNIMAPVNIIQESVEVRLDTTYGLTNGDKISYTWKVDEELSKYVKCSLKYKDDSYTVSGLTEVGTFDAFSDLEVTFSGVAPNGSVNYNYKSSELDNYDFSCNKRSGLSNGDIITISIYDNKLEYYAVNLGKVPEPLVKEYKVEGLSKYLSKISEINDTALSSMQQQASDVFNAHIAQRWEDGASLESFTYIGNYLLTAKNSDFYWGNNNALYMIYKAQVRNNYSNEDESYNKLNDVYWYISFDDLIVEPDGNLTVDVTDYNTPNDRFVIDSGISSGWWSTMSWYYYGYQTLDELYKNVVTMNIDSYIHEDNVDESAAPETVEAEDE